jgi:hypothetical protein
MCALAEHTETVDQGTILRWIDQLHESARAAAWGGLLEFEGVDLFEVLLAPIDLAVLAAARRGSAPKMPLSKQWLGRLRSRAYRWKMAWRERVAARRCAPASPTDILFWSRDRTHTSIMHPVAKAAALEGDACRLLACQPTAYETLCQVAADGVYTMRLWPRVVLQARREGARRAREIARDVGWVHRNDAASVPAAARAAAWEALLEFLPLAAEAVANARAALDAFRPKVLVVGNDVTVEGRAGCRVAKARGVPTAVFMHGSIGGDALQRRHCADRLLVYGKTQCRVLAQLGFGDDRVIACGAPNLDQRPRQTGRIHPELQQRFGLRPDEPWILVATSGPGHRISHAHHQQVIDELAALGRALPAVPLVVKLHRKDQLAYYDAALKNCGGKMLVVADRTPGLPVDIFDWLQGCCLVLTGASAVAVEAMLLDVPVVTMDFRDEVHDVDFIDAGATVHVRTGDSLVREVRTILESGASDTILSRVRGYLEDTFFALDGHSSQRGARALHELFLPRSTN